MCNIKKLNLKVKNILGDGNCAFSALVHGLEKYIGIRNTEIYQHLTSVGLTSDNGTAENTATLRKLFVQQLVRYKEKYQWRLGNFELANEENQCLKAKGAYYNDISNLVCPIMKEVLRILIVIVTSLSDIPTVMFNPFIGTPVTTAVLIDLCYYHLLLHLLLYCVFQKERVRENQRPYQKTCPRYLQFYF